MGACKKAFEDIKRAESIMSGRIKACFSPLSGRIQNASNKIIGINA
jgi:hypothetical protein